MKVTPITANFVADIEDVNLATINDTEFEQLYSAGLSTAC